MMKRTGIFAALCVTLITGCEGKSPATQNSSPTGQPAPQQSSPPVPGQTKQPTLPVNEKPASSSNEAVVKDTVKRYTQLLSEGYKTLNMNPLQEVATAELAEKAYYHMSAIGEGSTRMISKLKSIDFIETGFSSAKSSRVVTKEIWDFYYTELKTGARGNELKDYEYTVVYTLELQKNRWIITNIAATGEDRKEMPSWDTIIKERRKQVAK